MSKQYYLVQLGGKSMFGRNDCFNREIAEIQRKIEEFDRRSEERDREFQKAMESQKKANELMIAIANFAMSLANGSQDNKDKLEECLKDVKEDAALKGNQKVQKLVRDIYENMDDVNEMVEIVGRSGCLLSAVKIPI